MLSRVPIPASQSVPGARVGTGIVSQRAAGWNQHQADNLRRPVAAPDRRHCRVGRLATMVGCLNEPAPDRSPAGFLPEQRHVQYGDLDGHFLIWWMTRRPPASASEEGWLIASDAWAWLPCPNHRIHVHL